MKDNAPCAICGTPSEIEQSGPDAIRNCPRCGPWLIVSDPRTPVRVRDLVAPHGVDSPNRRARLSQIIRRQQRKGDNPVVLRPSSFDPAVLDNPPPTPAAQLDNLILWLADRQTDYSTLVNVPSQEVSAWIGAPIRLQNFDAPLQWLLRSDQGRFIECPGGLSMRLTLAGWSRAEQLRSHASVSRMAFLAMKFGDVEIDRVVTECFKPAAWAAGFELRAVNDQQSAGLIDDQMRVGLRQARFVVADLTHASNGAYWEAGFAEGAGKPVIYTCRHDHWSAGKSHFDTNHLATIVWDPARLKDAEVRLTAMIRATLPAEAKLGD
jgi:hypothetical protein